MRTPFIAGNWKMNKTVKEAGAFLEAIQSQVPKDGVETAICAPFVALPALVEAAKGTPVQIGAQICIGKKAARIPVKSAR